MTMTERILRTAIWYLRLAATKLEIIGSDEAPAIRNMIDRLEGVL
jgi:hypothetical protein